MRAWSRQQHRKKTTKKFGVTPERIDRTKMGVFRRAEKGELAGIYDFAVRFMVGPNGAYLDKDAAYDILDELDKDQMTTLTERIVSLAQEIAAPKV